MRSWRGPRERARTSRLQHRTWTDPRLLLGGMLVLGAAVLGSWAVSSSDDRVGYWALGEDVLAGDVVTEEQLVESRAVLDDAAADGVLRTDEELPGALADLRWAGDVTAGTLLGNAHLVASQDANATELPLAVTAGAAPDDLRRGELVDVWVGPAPGDDPTQTASRVMDSVPVVSTGSGSGLDTASASRTVIVDVGDLELTGEVVGRVSASHVTLVRRS